MTANSAPAPQPALTFRRYREGDDTYSSWQDAIFIAGRTDKCPIYVQRTSPCQGACPSGHDLRGWLRIVQGLEKPADGMSWQDAPFAA